MNKFGTWKRSNVGTLGSANGKLNAKPVSVVDKSKRRCVWGLKSHPVGQETHGGQVKRAGF